MDSWFYFCYHPVLYRDESNDEPNDDRFILWKEGDFGLCFEQVVIALLGFTLLALVSGFYCGTHFRFTRKTAHSLGPCLKGLVTIVLLLNSLVQFVGSFWLVQYQPYAVMLSHIVELLCWFVHLVCLIVLSRSVLHIGYGPLPLNLMWGLTLLFSILNFRTSIQYVRFPQMYYHRGLVLKGYLSLLLQVTSYVRFGFQSLYLVLLLVPAKPETAESSLVLDSSTQYISRVPLLSGRGKKAEDVVSSENIDYGSIQVRRPKIDLTSEDDANPLSFLSFWWLTSLMQKGAAGYLQSPSDLPVLPRSLSTERVREKFQKVLRKQEQQTDTLNDASEHTLRSLDRLSQYSFQQSIPRGAINEEDEDQPYYALNSSAPLMNDTRLPDSPATPTSFSLIGALNRAFGLHYYPLGLMKLAGDGLGFAGPLLLHQLVGFMENKKVCTHTIIYPQMLVSFCYQEPMKKIYEVPHNFFLIIMGS